MGGDDACGCNGSVGAAGVGVFKSKFPSRSNRSLLCVTAVELGEEFLVVAVAGIVTPTSVVPSKSKSALCKIVKKKESKIFIRTMFLEFATSSRICYRKNINDYLRKDNFVRLLNRM